MKETDAMREIHEIRERLYEEEKDLTVAQKVAKIKKEAKNAMSKYGLKLREYEPDTH